MRTPDEQRTPEEEFTKVVGDIVVGITTVVVGAITIVIALAIKDRILGPKSLR